MLSVLVCATLVVGTAMTVYAAETACSHSNYSVEDAWTGYTDGFNDDFHWCFDWEDRYCLDCGGYYSVKVNTYTDDHGYIDGVCVYCGHKEE